MMMDRVMMVMKVSQYSFHRCCYFSHNLKQNARRHKKLGRYRSLFCGSAFTTEKERLIVKPFRTAASRVRTAASGVRTAMSHVHRAVSHVHRAMSHVWTQSKSGLGARFLTLIWVCVCQITGLASILAMACSRAESATFFIEPASFSSFLPSFLRFPRSLPPRFELSAF